jgi:CheY-like chemotaxis protein
MPNKNIFIVDDDSNLTKALNTLFSGSGYNISIAANGKAAQEKLKNTSFDLTILDMHMPGLDGPAVLKIINQNYPDTKVIVLTGLGREYKEKIKGLKYQAFLTKPFSAVELADTAKAVLEGKQLPEKEIDMYNDPYIMPEAKLLILDTDGYRLSCLNGYFTTKEHCGGRYEVGIRHIDGIHLFDAEKAEQLKHEIEKDLMLSEPDIILGCAEIYGFSSASSGIYPAIRNSVHKPKDMIIYGEDITVRGRYGQGFEGVINRLKQLSAGKPIAGDPILDKLGKAVRESAIRSSLYIRVKEHVRIPAV